MLFSSKVRQVRSVKISGMGFAELRLGVNLVSYKSPLDFTPKFSSSFGEGIVVVMSLDDFKTYEATFHLLSSKNNADRLNDAIDELRSGGGTERELIEE